MSTPCPVPRDPGPAGTSPGVYQRRRPERTAPYQAVQEQHFSSHHRRYHGVFAPKAVVLAGMAARPNFLGESLDDWT